MLLGLVRPTAGASRFSACRRHKPGARARLGFLPEPPYFPSQLTAGEAMALYGQLCGLSRAELAEQTAELLDRVGLDGRQKTLLSKFSRGMLQRLGLAQALLGRPEVLVLDEPASGLDPVGQRDVRNLMVELKNAGATILLSSHQLSEVEAISDEVTILNRGRVAARGHIDALLNVAGQTSVTARGEGELPAGRAVAVEDVAVDGATQVFSIADERVRERGRRARRRGLERRVARAEAGVARGLLREHARRRTRTRCRGPRGVRADEEGVRDLEGRRRRCDPPQGALGRRGVLGGSRAWRSRRLPSYGVGVVDAVFREVVHRAHVRGRARHGARTRRDAHPARGRAAHRLQRDLSRRSSLAVRVRDVARHVRGARRDAARVHASTTIAIGAFTYHAPMWQLFEASLAVWFEIGVIMAFAVMLSCSFGPVTSAVGALAFAFVGHAFVSLLELPELAPRAVVHPDPRGVQRHQPRRARQRLRARVRRGHDARVRRPGSRCSCSAPPRMFSRRDL